MEECRALSHNAAGSWSPGLRSHPGLGEFQGKRMKNGQANHSFPGSTPVPGVVFGVPPKNRVGGTPTRTRGTRVLPGKSASRGGDHVFAREGSSMRLPWGEFIPFGDFLKKNVLHPSGQQRGKVEDKIGAGAGPGECSVDFFRGGRFREGFEAAEHSEQHGRANAGVMPETEIQDGWRAAAEAHSHAKSMLIGAEPEFPASSFAEEPE